MANAENSAFMEMMNEFQLALVKADKKAKSAEKSAQGWGEH